MIGDVDDFDALFQRVIYLEAIVQKLSAQFNTHTHGGVTTGAGTSSATAAGFQVMTDFTLNRLP